MTFVSVSREKMFSRKNEVYKLVCDLRRVEYEKLTLCGPARLLRLNRKNPRVQTKLLQKITVVTLPFHALMALYKLVM